MVIDPREVMTVGILGHSAKSMAGSMAVYPGTVACLNDQEWEAAAPEMVMEPDERAAMQCFMEAQRGPVRMAEDLKNGNRTKLEKLTLECGLITEPGPDTTTPAETPAT